jgi:hypothetical protein
MTHLIFILLATGLIALLNLNCDHPHLVPSVCRAIAIVGVLLIVAMVVAGRYWRAVRQ